MWWDKVKLDPQDLRPAYPKDCIRKIAICSDTHIGHKRQQLTHLKEFYRIAEERGCRFVLHAGDLTDGLSEGHENERFLFTTADMISYIVDNYPDNLDTFVISGNHDDNIYKTVGVDICATIETERSDFRYMGMAEAFFDLEKTKIFIGHDICARAGGLENTYQYACRSKKMPDLLVNGHFHSWGIVPFNQGAFLFQAPCFQGQTDSMKLRRQMPAIGAAILYFYPNNLRSIECFHYDELEHDY